MLSEEPLHEPGFPEYAIPDFMARTLVFSILGVAARLAQRLDHVPSCRNAGLILAALKSPDRQICNGRSGFGTRPDTAHKNRSSERARIIGDQSPCSFATDRLTNDIDALRIDMKLRTHAVQYSEHHR